MNDGLHRRHPDEVPFYGFQMDAFGAVRTGVVQPDAVFTVLAVDQQQEVDGSRNAELLIIVQRHGMERKAQAVKKPSVVLG